MKWLLIHTEVMNAKYWSIEISVYLLALLMIVTAGSKIADLDKFAGQITNQPFDNRFTDLLTYGVPAAEIILVIGLLWPSTRLFGLYGTAVLLTIFTIYIALVTFNFYDRVPCGCAFAFEKLSWPQHLMINLFFTLLSYFAIAMIKRTKFNTISKT
jgi:putative oxidoreductase